MHFAAEIHYCDINENYYNLSRYINLDNFLMLFVCFYFMLQEMGTQARFHKLSNDTKYISIKIGM